MLTIKFTLKDCDINYECLHIDEVLRGKLRFKSNNGFYFYSELHPKIYVNKKIVNLRGEETIVNLRGNNRSQDNEEQTIKFDSISERDSFIGEVKKAFEELRRYFASQFEYGVYSEPVLRIEDKGCLEKTVESKTEEKDYEYLTADKARKLYEEAHELIRKRNEGREERIKTFYEEAIKAIDKQILKGVSSGCKIIIYPYSFYVKDFLFEREKAKLRDFLQDHYISKGFGCTFQGSLSYPDIKIKLFPEEE